MVKLQSFPSPTGTLIAWNPVAQREVWRVIHPVLESGGVLATAGNLVFQGRSDGIFLAYRATDGAKLWEFDAGTGIMAPPVSYLLNGVQYITLMAGWGGVGLINSPGRGPTKAGFGRILTFAIGGTTRLDVPPFGHRERPVPTIQMNASQRSVREGKFLYATFCYRCHGVDAVAGSGVPDLRYSIAEVNKEFAAIVLERLSFARIMAGSNQRQTHAPVTLLREPMSGLAEFWRGTASPQSVSFLKRP